MRGRALSRALTAARCGEIGFEGFTGCFSGAGDGLQESLGGCQVEFRKMFTDELAGNAFGFRVAAEAQALSVNGCAVVDHAGNVGGQRVVFLFVAAEEGSFTGGGSGLAGGFFHDDSPGWHEADPLRPGRLWMEPSRQTVAIRSMRMMGLYGCFWS